MARAFKGLSIKSNQLLSSPKPNVNKFVVKYCYLSISITPEVNCIFMIKNI